MIGRLFYLVAGAAIGGYVVHRLNRTVRAWSPGGIADRVEGHVADHRAALREFNEDVLDAMEHREAELRRLYGDGQRGEHSGKGISPGRPALPPGRANESHGATDAPYLKDGR
ncbi:hypothetical protein CDO52_19205 [Nocardiopsis gilva YIM 90087]|uniref:Uncharacterized protein n=1 Tax=Nocardiopsis gilva YIM 90087 TaxID=1235441 RepID=A0A223S941_9ACTN|nr:hypothetical protein [Nocardiopsis gilva]ASU84645.1 hypothetical protein CDO52_19205 [Nocardiopsis gilva YIM 90087]